jgi:ABC-type uncharacterized transport system involved in gliding motility auxiliary subunit
MTLFFRVDLTSNNLYSLSKASKNVVSTLKEPLTINVFFTKNLPAPYNNVERYLRDLLEEYEIYANKYLSYRFYDVSAQEGDLSEKAEKNRKLAQNYGIYPVNVQRIARDETQIQRAYMGMALIHGDVIEKLPDITSTEGLEYRITNAIERMNNKISVYLNLPEKIKVKLVQSSSIDIIARLINLQGLANLKSQVRSIVEKLKGKTYGQLEFLFVDPDKDPAAGANLGKYQRFAIQWQKGQTPQGEVIEAGKGILALGMEYGDKSLERPLLNRSMKLTERGFEEQYSLPTNEELEAFVRENIDNMIDINEDLGYLSSHDTRTLAPKLPPQLEMMQQQRPGELKKLNRLLNEEYTVKPVDITKEEIPESIDTLIIAGPKTNFSDWELLRIDQFLMKGKSLALFIDSYNEIQPKRQSFNYQQPVYLPLNTGLEKLLDHYGVRVKKSYLMDESCFIRKSREGEMKFYFAPIVKNEYINHKPGYMKNITELITIKVSPLEIIEDKIKENNIKAVKLLASTEDAWEMKGRINLFPPMIQPPTNEEEKSSMPIAYVLEGEFPSYFADKEIPEKPAEEEKKDEEEGEDAEKDAEKKEEKSPVIKESKLTSEKQILRKGRPGKIFIIGSSEILMDNVLDEEGNGPNSIFLLNMFDYLNNQEDIAVMRGKKQRFNPIKDTKPFTRFFIKTLNIGGMTAAIILLGVFIFIGRKTRRKAIRQMFKKSNE